MGGKRWTVEDNKFLTYNYLTMSLAELAKHLCRAKKSIQGRLDILGLHRPEPTDGTKFNRLTIITTYMIDKYGQQMTMAECICDCGNKYIGKLTSIVTDRVKSCGCLKRETSSQNAIKKNTTHGGSRTKLYRIWAAMRNRCNNQKDLNYDRYGGRGIYVSEEWNKFADFRDWANANGYAEGLSIDRVQNDGPYSAENCKWVTMYEQCGNRSNSIRIRSIQITAFGETKPMTEWFTDERCVVNSVATIAYRIGAGWTPEEAITKPSERQKK